MTSAARFRPVRAGIVNLYEYAEQVFELAGGRLLLRGHNTSGKTKALELLLPFCLDGDISPRKLDPFARNAKEMRWNLVGCTDRDQRIGYVWVEFERVGAEAGAPDRITAGIGMSANRSLPGVKRWYFVARGRRIGSDLELLHGRNPLSKRDLAAALGDDGELLDTQSAYRERLNQLVFGFPSMAAYRTMLTLMLELRRPHLSKTLDPEAVARLLSAGLPEVDGELMRRLGDGLEQLEALEQGLERLRGVRDRLRSFHERTYRAYLRAVLRERAGALRRADGQVEAAAAALREAREQAASATEEAERVAGELREAVVLRERSEGEERAIVTSPAWASVAEVEQLGERAAAVDRAAAAAEAAATDAAGLAGSLEAELIAAEAAASEDAAALADGLAALGEAAAAAGLGARHEALTDQLDPAGSDPRTWAELVGDLARGWRAVLDRHETLLDAQAAAAAALERCRELEATATERARREAERRRAAEEELGARRDEIGGAIAAWAEGLAELSVDPVALTGAQELAARGEDGRAALAPVADSRRSELHGERAALDARHSALLAERDELAARRARLEAERDEAPPVPALRRADRAGRRGAPLWRLVDFADDVSGSERAGIEAALEAMGLLDAWITPDGAALDARTHDTLLVADGEPAEGRTLADVLVVAGGVEVPDGVIRAVLARVAVADGAALADRREPAVLDPAGSFRLGPLAGAAGKEHAEYVGAAARAARRARLVAELREQEAMLTERLDGLVAGVRDLDARLEALTAELAGFPPADAVASALRALGVIEALAATAAAEHEQAAADSRAAAERHVAADAAAREHAVEHALPPGIDRRALGARREACAGYAVQARPVAVAAGAVARSRANVARARAELAARQDAAGRLAQAAAAERAEAKRLHAEHAARVTSLGSTGEELRTRHAEVAAALRGARAATEELGERDRAAGRALAIAEAQLEPREQAHAAAREDRAGTHASFVRLGAADAFDLALGAAAPEDRAAAASWTLTRALEVVRALPDELLDVRSAAGELAQEVTRRASLLDRELAEAEMGVYTAPDADGLVLVRVTEGPSERSLSELLEGLDHEIADRERVLSVEQRRVFGDALLEEIAEHLRSRIHDVRGRVERMNAILARCPTAAGKSVQLEWRPLDDDDGRLRGAVGLLRRPMAFLGEGDRRTLVEFFRGRAEAARRARAEEAGEPLATLAAAFDYRTWFAFGLLEDSAGDRRRLTAKRHAVGSGGEQAVLIHLPLFAAAAALYDGSEDGRAPRLVMLDEALSGIDDETRARVLAATVALDLDLVMTSHELWGTYRTVPSLAIYQLHREPGEPGVLTVPFVWDGEVLHEHEQAALGL